MKKVLFFIFIIYRIHAQGFSIARIHYSGGGDWYSDPSSIPNLINFVIDNTNIKMDKKEYRLKLDDPKIFNHTYIYITGHGNIRFNENEILNLRKFLLNGGFLHADDNYGMNKSFRREMKKVFPEKDWIELPKDHNIYNTYFNLPNGLPKIHEHDGKKAQGFGLFENNTLIAFYSYESDLGDGWEDQEVHNNPYEIRLTALRMGTNIIWYSMVR
tara:strand:+ start:353 stop:994 length:642 start_codon:yes stop_codon:yes gene_type:complete